MKKTQYYTMIDLFRSLSEIADMRFESKNAKPGEGMGASAAAAAVLVAAVGRLRQDTIIMSGLARGVDNNKGAS